MIKNEHDWINHMKARGLDGALGLALDALEPLGPLGAQMLWVLQPALGVLGGPQARAAVDDLAQALEAPGGVDRLRARLERSWSGEDQTRP